MSSKKISKEDMLKENIEALNNGIHNLLRHVDNIKNKFGLNVIVAINKCDTKDSKSNI